MNIKACQVSKGDVLAKFAQYTFKVQILESKKNWVKYCRGEFERNFRIPFTYGYWNL